MPELALTDTPKHGYPVRRKNSKNTGRHLRHQLLQTLIDVRNRSHLILTFAAARSTFITKDGVATRHHSS